jgi:hypothetical protein
LTTFASVFRTSAFCLLPFAFASCAARVFVPPTGAGEPAPEAAAVWTSAAASCRDVKSYTAFFNVSGTVEGERIRSIGIEGVVTGSDELRLNGVALGRTVFVLAGRLDRATIVISDRFLTARADDLVEALVGVRLTPREIVAVLSGCVSPATEIRNARRFGPDTLAVDLASARVFLRQTGGAWRVVAGEIGQRIAVSYDRFAGAFPGRIQVGTGAAERRTAVTMRVEDRELDRVFPASTFEVTPPPNATPITIDDLRAALRGGN